MEDDIRAAAHQRNDAGRDAQHPSRDKHYIANKDSRLLGDPLFRDKVASHIDSIPLDPAKLKYCPACEGALCGLCGKCHDLDRKDWHKDRGCPAVHHHHQNDECCTWTYAYRFLKDEDRKLRSKA